MLRLAAVSISIGILGFLCVYFLAPAMVSASAIVSYVAEFALYLSNASFETMPSIMAGYIANLNLAVAALTTGLVLMVVTQLLMVLEGALIFIAKWIASRFRKGQETRVVEDLPPVEMNSSFMRSPPGKEILGRGIDAIDRN